MTTTTEPFFNELELLEMFENSKLERVATAAEKSATALDRLAQAAESIANALASVIGTGTSRCYGEGDDVYLPVSYVRTGRGERHFTCDADNASVGED